MALQVADRIMLVKQGRLPNLVQLDWVEIKVNGVRFREPRSYRTMFAGGLGRAIEETVYITIEGEPGWMHEPHSAVANQVATAGVLFSR